MKEPKSNNGIKIIHIKVLYIVLAVLLAFSAITVFLNIEQLKRIPFKTTDEIDEPIIAIENDSREMAVIDSEGSRLIILNSEREIAATVSYNSFSEASPQRADDASIDERYIYILDHILSDNGISVVADRVIVFDLTGKYVKTMISSENMQDDEHSYRIYTLACHEGRVYATVYDEYDNSVLYVAEITEGQISILHEYQTESIEIFDAYYQPEIDVTTAVMYDGSLMYWKEASQASKIRSKENELFDDTFFLEDGNLISLNLNDNTIAIYDDQMEREQVLARTYADNFSLSNNRLIYAELDDYSINTVDMTTGKIESFNHVSYCDSIIVWGYITWIALVTGILAAALLLLMLVIRITKRYRKLKEQQDSNRNDNKIKKLSLGYFYGPLFVALVLIFGISALVMGAFYSGTMLSKKEGDVLNTAYILSESEGKYLGDYLKKINSQSDYGSEAYNTIVGYTRSICMTDARVSTSNDLSCTVYRFIDNTDDIMLISDAQAQYRVGTIFSLEEQKRRLIDEIIADARNALPTTVEFKYKNDARIYAVYAPVSASDDSVAGVVAISVNKGIIKDEINSTLFSKLLELFTFLAGMCMVIGELKYFIGVTGMYKQQKKPDHKKFTLPEISRTLEILIYIPGMVITIFITLIAGEILGDAIGNRAVLVALPLTIECITCSVIQSLFSPLVKYRPRMHMLIAASVNILGCAFMALATYTKDFDLLLVSSAVFGMGEGYAKSTVRTIFCKGKPLSERYEEMVFHGYEEPISFAIGASIAAVIKTYYGNISIFVFSAILLLMVIPIVILYVHEDIGIERSAVNGRGNREKRRNREYRQQAVAHVKKLLKFAFHPTMLECMLISNLIINFLWQFSGYVMPIFNNSLGYPDTIVGTITLFLELIILFVVPVIVRYADIERKAFWIPKILLLLSVVLLIFGFDGSMRAFVLIILVEEIAATTSIPMIENKILDISNKYSLNPNDTMVLYDIIRNLPDYIGPVILSLMMAKSFNNLGWIWGIICVGFAIVTLILEIAARRSEENCNE